MPIFELANATINQLMVRLIASSSESQFAFVAEDMVEIDIIPNFVLDNNWDNFNKIQIQDVINNTDLLLLEVDAANTEQVDLLLKIAKISMKLGILTIVIETLPFPWSDEQHQLQVITDTYC